jgi:hypothetical protein
MGQTKVACKILFEKHKRDYLRGVNGDKVILLKWILNTLEDFGLDLSVPK